MILSVINQCGIKASSTSSLNRSGIKVVLSDAKLDSLDIFEVPLSLLLGLEVLLSDVACWTSGSLDCSLVLSSICLIVSWRNRMGWLVIDGVLSQINGDVCFFHSVFG
jgi:hypothetical protein